MRHSHVGHNSGHQTHNTHQQHSAGANIYPSHRGPNMPSSSHSNASRGGGPNRPSQEPTYQSGPRHTHQYHNYSPNAPAMGRTQSNNAAAAGLFGYLLGSSRRPSYAYDDVYVEPLPRRGFVPGRSAVRVSVGIGAIVLLAMVFLVIIPLLMTASGPMFAASSGMSLMASMPASISFASLMTQVGLGLAVLGGLFVSAMGLKYCFFAAKSDEKANEDSFVAKTGTHSSYQNMQKSGLNPSKESALDDRVAATPVVQSQVDFLGKNSSAFSPVLSKISEGSENGSASSDDSTDNQTYAMK